jgi:hypothetical protein
VAAPRVKTQLCVKLALVQNPRVERSPKQPGGATDRLTVSSFIQQLFPEHLLRVGLEPAKLACLPDPGLLLGTQQQGPLAALAGSPRILGWWAVGHRQASL